MSCDQKYSYIHVSLQLLFTDSSIHNIIIHVYYNYTNEILNIINGIYYINVCTYLRT